MLKRYSYRAYPTGEQVHALNRLFGCCRVVFNDFIAARAYDHQNNLPFQSMGDLSRKLLTEAKQTSERQWLSEVSSVALQQSLRDADRAYRNFFDGLSGKRKKRVGAPRFKSRSNRQSARFTQAARFKVRRVSDRKGRLLLPKVGEVEFIYSRDLPSAPTSVTIIRQPSGIYELSFVVDAEPKELPRTEHIAGVDVGLTHVAVVTSTSGERWKVDNPRLLRGRERRLARLQRSMSRKKKGSANRNKARAKVARQHRKVSDARRDFNRKTALNICRENQVVGVEGLNIAGLARTRMAKSIHDAGWAQLARFIGEYRTVFIADRWFPSTKMCSVCGVIGARKPLNIRVWTCPDCGAHLDRDFNAAVNLMVAAGLAETGNACGVDVRLRLASAVDGEAGTRRTDRGSRVSAA